jgi:hypothetical protein
MALAVNDCIFILRDTLNEYQPLSYFEYQTYDNSYVETPEYMPDGYIHWLQLFDDVWGNVVDVLYPKQPLKKGQCIDIFYRGFYEAENEWKVFEWYHGDEGLFEQVILPQLKQERTYRQLKFNKKGQIDYDL